MSFFENADRPDIKGGQFVNVTHGDAHLHFSESNQGLKILHQNVATGAFHDAAERGDPPKCHPHTRAAVLSEIKEWVRGSEAHKKFIIWLYGPAGSGKSAIAQTIAEFFVKEQPVMSFFFSRTGIGRSDTSRFIASIAYQLCTSIPEVCAHIAAAVKQDPLIFTRTLRSQMEALIIKPLNAAAAASAADFTQAGVAHPRLVIIDGLDEARDPTTQRELIQALATCIEQLPIRFVFLLASRPETIIRQTFNTEPLQSLMQRLALDENYQPDNDIRIFLSAEFSEIRELHPSGNTLPVEWPTQDDIDYLVRKASGQFIYASTVMKYIKTSQRNPRKQLKVIRDMADPGKDTPFAQLDALYTLILSSVEDLTRVLEILTLIFFTSGRPIDGVLSVDFIETLLEYDSGDVAVALTDMHALVRVPSDSDDDTDTLHIYHASLHDFLIDKSRSQHFFLDASVRRMDLARFFLKFMTTRVAKGLDQSGQLWTVLQEFFYHYEELCNLEGLVTDLKEFSLTSLLSNISIRTFYSVYWDGFFDSLRRKCTETNTHLYQRLRDEFDNWICNQFEQYPVFFRRCISAALVTLDLYDLQRDGFAYLRDIFNILMQTLSPPDPICLRKLDQQLFLFQAPESYSFDSCVDHTILRNFFINPSWAGVHFPDKVDFGNLAEQIVMVLYQRGENCAQIVARSYYDKNNDIYPDSEKTLKIQHTDLDFFPKILAAAPEDHKLAKLLWDLVVMYKDDVDDPLRIGRETVARSALKYIKRCEIFVPEHRHWRGCLICANFTPTFSIPPVEPEEDGMLPNTISPPDESSGPRSGIPLSISQNISPKMPAIQTDITSSSSFQSSTIPPSPTTMRNRAAKLPPSTTPHFSDSLSTSSFSPGSHSVRSSPRPTSADPSTSKSGSHRPSTSLLVTSRTRPRSTTPSNSSLSPHGPPTSTVTHTSRPKGRHGQSASIDVSPTPKSTTGKATKKPWK